MLLTPPPSDAPRFLSPWAIRQPAFVKHYYFYRDDAQFGEAFIKICSYAPYPIKVCLNGHAWAKRQLQHQGIGFEALDNGFWKCADARRLQQTCDELGPPVDVPHPLRNNLQELDLVLERMLRHAHLQN